MSKVKCYFIFKLPIDSSLQLCYSLNIKWHSSQTVIMTDKKLLTGIPHNDCVRAYKQGRIAAEKGLAMTANPYVSEKGRYFAAVRGEWNRGWLSFSY
jgi:hypothetical protein